MSLVQPICCFSKVRAATAACTLSTILMFTAAAAVDDGNALQDPHPANQAHRLRPSERFADSLRHTFFVPNEGQWTDKSVIYGLHAPHWQVAFRPGEIEFTLRQTAGPADSNDRGVRTEASINQAHVALIFPGSNPVEPIGLETTSTSVNYFVGGDDRASAAGLPTFSTLAYPDLYDGIDLHVVNDQSNGTLKYEFHVAPGADPSQISMQYSGLDCPLAIDADGALHIESALGTVIDHAPVAYQIIDGRPVDVSSSYDLESGSQCAFVLGDEYDPALPLVIDPQVEWMTYLGGSQMELGQDAAFDAHGNLLIAGITESRDFEGRGNSIHSASSDGFVLKIDSTGAMQWMTYVGGKAADRANAIAVNVAGDIFIAGETESTDFEGRMNSSHGMDEAFAARLNSAGTVQWMMYLGGSLNEGAQGIALDPSDNIYATGRTSSSDFEGALNSYQGVYDGHITKLDASGQLQWMTYLRGSDADFGFGLAVDQNDDVIAVGHTLSTNFAGRLNNSSNHGGWDTYVVRVNSAGSLERATYLGGQRDDYGYGVAIDPRTNEPLVCGTTESVDFEGRINPFNGVVDGYLARVSTALNVQWMTYLGGSSSDYAGNDIQLDNVGAALIAGETESSDFEGATNSTHGQREAALLRVKPAGAIDWMLYLGGSGHDWGFGLAVDDSADRAVVTGSTESSDFQGRNNAFHGGINDAFATRVSIAPYACLTLANSGLVAGKSTTWQISNAVTGARGVLVWGTAQGQTSVSDYQEYCATFGIKGVNPSHVVGFWAADQNGEATIKRAIPSGTSGMTILTQAAEQGTCPDECMSNVLKQTVK